MVHPLKSGIWMHLKVKQFRPFKLPQTHYALGCLSLLPLILHLLLRGGEGAMVNGEQWWLCSGSQQDMDGGRQGEQQSVGAGFFSGRTKVMTGLRRHCGMVQGNGG